MSYDDQVARVCRLSNGWELEIYDPTPKQEKAAAKAEDKGMPISYGSGWRSFAFTTDKELLAFLTQKLPMLKPSNHDEEYQAAFNAGIESASPKKKSK